MPMSEHGQKGNKREFEKKRDRKELLKFVGTVILVLLFFTACMYSLVIMFPK